MPLIDTSLVFIKTLKIGKTNDLIIRTWHSYTCFLRLLFNKFKLDAATCEAFQFVVGFGHGNFDSFLPFFGLDPSKHAKHTALVSLSN